MAQRVLLDTNIWRALADSGCVADLVSAARKHDVNILVAPATVYETLATPDPAIRNHVLQVQTHPAWVRLMPEAYYECEEIMIEVRRLHPEWLVEAPDLTMFNRQVRDWTRKVTTGKKLEDLGFWLRARRHPDEMAEATRFPLLETARAQSRDVRKWNHEKKLRPLKQIDQMRVYLEGQSPESDVEAWRWHTLASFAVHIQNPGDPYRDWLFPFFKSDPDLMGSDPWTMFWIHEADRMSVPRQWIRWAFAYLQGFSTPSRGTPGDAQLSSHFLDCDHVVSADRQLISLTDQLRSQTPFQIPAAHQLWAPKWPRMN